MRSMLWIALSGLISSGLGCQAAAPGARSSTQVKAPARGPAKGLSGLATWYGKPFHGRRTASGERYDMRRLTAAHRSLPFGTVVRVTNLKNRRQVVVRISDRGPFGKGRVIDLSQAAASRLHMLETGVVPVKIDVIKWGRHCRTFHGRTTCRVVAPPGETKPATPRPRARQVPVATPRRRRSLRRARYRRRTRRRRLRRRSRRRRRHRRWRRTRSPLLRAPSASRR